MVIPVRLCKKKILLLLLILLAKSQESSNSRTIRPSWNGTMLSLRTNLSLGATLPIRWFKGQFQMKPLFTSFSNFTPKSSSLSLKSNEISFKSRKQLAKAQSGTSCWLCGIRCRTTRRSQVRSGCQLFSAWCHSAIRCKCLAERKNQVKWRERSSNIDRDVKDWPVGSADEFGDARTRRTSFANLCPACRPREASVPCRCFWRWPWTGIALPPRVSWS